MLSIMGSYAIPPPPLPELDGTPVGWQDWDEAVMPLCSRMAPLCEECGYEGRALTCHGLVPYTETSTDVALERLEARAAGRRLHRRRGERKTWPAVRLVAFLCPSCRDLRVLDSWNGFEEIVLGAPPALFDL